MRKAHDFFHNFKSAIEWPQGLDDIKRPVDEYGDPIEVYRHPYVRGSEADVGDFKPVQIGGAFDGLLARIRAAMAANEKADSPIESILGAAIILAFEKNDRPLTLASEPSDDIKGLLLIPQFSWSIYRSDWAIYNPKTSGALLIECDGKAFHSSPQQIEHDQRKDQAAHDRGYLTMRFSGAQIHKSADDCAKKIFDLVYGGPK